MTPKILIVGVGNPIRQDDGVGHYCVALLEKGLVQERKKLVDFMVVHQLDIAHCERFADYKLIIIVDADAQIGYEPLRIEQVDAHASTQPFTSHIGSASDLLSLTQALHGSNPKMYIVAVRGECFEVGEGLTSIARENANLVLAIVEGLLQELFPLG